MKHSATPTATPTPAAQVRQRQVFYVSGFDPKGPAHYHRLYAEEAAKAAAVGGYTVRVGRRRKVSEQAAGWSVTYEDARHGRVSTEFEFLRWDDIIRAHWPKQPRTLAWDLLRTKLLYVRSGALWTMFKLAWPPVVALTLPVPVLLALLGALALSLVLAIALASALGSTAVGALAGGALFGGAYALARFAERRLNMQWLLRSYAFTGGQGTHGWPALEARLDAFARRIAERLHQASGTDATAPCDEVLIVAHSSGSIMAVAALARALSLDPKLTQRGPRVALMTLGQCLPMLSSLPGASAFRAEIDRLARDPALDWVDFTAPPDGCCFALVDPITAAGLAPARANHPRLLSPRFAAMFPPATYAAIKRDRFRLHFQYLMAGELPSDYDYTAITAGPLRLGERHAAMPSVTDFVQFRWRWGKA